MVRFIIRRLVLLALTLLVSSVIIFVILNHNPRGIAVAVLGQFATEEDIARVQTELGFDRPPVERYLSWLGNFVIGDWGDSYVMRVPAREIIFQRLENSLVLAVCAFVVIIPFSILMGIIAGANENKPIDRIISFVGLGAIALPEFVSGVFLIVIFGFWLGWLPPTAAIPPDSNPFDSFKVLVLPILTLMLVDFAYIARMTRATTSQALNSNYVRTAVLKGLPRRMVLRRHVFRNALLPVITVVANQVGWLLGGLVIVETLFAYPGIGSLWLDAAVRHDLPMLQAISLLMALIYAVSNLVADLLYAFFNPRIRYS